MRVLEFPSDRPTAATADSTPALGEGTAACLGAFDGMHLGHQALLGRAREVAQAIAVVTFEPRPAEVLAPERAPARIQSPRQRARVCRALGVDTLAVLAFDRAVSRLSPAEFVDTFLIGLLGPGHLVVGYDFRFGAGRAGGPEELEALLRPAGIGVSVVDKIAAQTQPGSAARPTEKLGSTAIRRHVRAGEVERAAALLGRFHAVAGTVQHGAARGRTLGFPTANVSGPGLLPRPGVYACFLGLLDAAGELEVEHWPAVANVGTNPTFTDGGPTTLEVHALDVDLGERLYGREVEVYFVDRLRDEVRFDGADALRAAIAADILRARPRLAGRDDERHPTPIGGMAAPSPAARTGGS